MNYTPAASTFIYTILVTVRQNQKEKGEGKENKRVSNQCRFCEIKTWPWSWMWAEIKLSSLAFCFALLLVIIERICLERR